MQSHVWHPYTQMSQWNSFDVIVKGRGMWLYDRKGRRLLDGVASMWCNVWGHSRAEIVRSMISQTKKLQHSSLFNLTNDKAEALAEKLVSICPGMHRVFYSDDGSTAMEASAKMALQYWQNMGERKKTKFIVLENGYHGDTIGAMSLGYVPAYFSSYKSVIFPTIKVPSPRKYRIPKGLTYEDYYNSCLEKLEAALSRNDNIAALVMESGAQLAGGVTIYPKGYQRAASRLCKKHGTLFVLDEIATGLGRLGSMVEYEAQESRPDIASFGKMLTAGYIPLAATLASKRVYDAFLSPFEEMKHFFHGHTFTGNPLACAAAIENLNLYERHKIISMVRKNSVILSKRINEIAALDMVGDVRYKGMLMGIEMVSDKTRKTPIPHKANVPLRVFKEAKKHGIYLRTLGSIIMLVPPLAIPEQDLVFLIDGTISTIENVSKQIIP